MLIAFGWQEPLVSFQSLLRKPDPLATSSGGRPDHDHLLIPIFSGFRREPGGRALVEVGELGEVLISVVAIEQMVKKAAMKIKGVREVKPKIRCVPEGVAVFLQVQVAADINIPQATAEIQQEIRGYLENTAGLHLLEAKVLVDHITRDLKNRVE